jgi:hypothetical protein
MRRLRTLRAALVGAMLAPAAVALAPVAGAGMTIGHYNLIIDGRFDFHTWIWTIASCNPPAGVEECAVVSAIPQPIAKAYEWYGRAQRAGGIYTMTVDIPDGLRCGNVYYGPIIATRDVYTWDAATLSGTLQSSFAAGCDNTPGGTLTYPFQLVRL